MRVLPLALAVAALTATTARAAARSADVAPYVSVDARLVALTHVRVIDGSGAPAREDQTVVIEGDRLAAIGPAATTRIPAGALELLVEAGLTPLEAIQVGTANGARYLGRLETIGTLAPGKRADLVLVKGDPSRRIADVENVETVFKDGVGYDSRRLIESVRGQFGIR